jgi:hypothetical protein
MANIDWGVYTQGRPFHKCRGCDRQLAPGDGPFCMECEKWDRANGLPPEDPNFGDPDLYDAGEAKKPNPSQP